MSVGQAPIPAPPGVIERVDGIEGIERFEGIERTEGTEGADRGGAVDDWRVTQVLGRI